MDRLKYERFDNSIQYNWEVDDSSWQNLAVVQQNPVALILKFTLKDPDGFNAQGKLHSLCSKNEKKVVKFGGVWVATSLSYSEGCQYFYLQNEAIADELIAYSSKGFVLVDNMIYSDPNWVMFKKDAYPNAAQRQSMKNREIIEIYKKRGDDLVVPRRVNHMLCFTDEVSRLGFCQSAKNAGFALGDSHYTTEGALPHVTRVVNIAAINPQSIDACTAKLIDIAKEYNGEYSFWDCPVISKRKL